MATSEHQSPASQAAETATALQNPKPEVVADSIESELAKKANKIYFSVPEKNMLGWDHPGFGLNMKHYGPGTHQVDQLTGEELQRRSELYNNGVLALLQPQINRLVQAKLHGQI